MDTATVRGERGTLALRKARSDRQIRDFVKNRIVPRLRQSPEQMASTRILFPELCLGREGQVANRGATKLKPNLAMFERIMGGGVSITVSDIFSKLFPDISRCASTANMRGSSS